MFFDGLCEPINPGGVACYGFVVYDGKRRVHTEHGIVGAGMLGDDMTNNVAEYTAVIKGLKWLYENGMTKEKVRYSGTQCSSLSR